MNRCISRKDYLKKYNSNVGYALYVQDNIKKDDYARLNTGQIVKIIGIKENKLDKKAIYFNIYNEDWCNSAAVENFSENIIDLLEVGDFVNGESVIEVHSDLGYVFVDKETELGTKTFCDYQVETILTKEQYMQNCYKLVDRPADS